MNSCVISTPLGFAEIKGDAKGISSVTISDEKTAPSADVPAVLKACAKQLASYFRGERSKFDLPLHLEGSEFQKKVWNQLLKIPFGKTTTYLKLSRELGDEKAIRAVAAANGKNPLWIIVPCHRVIGSDGSLTGYAGGLDRKQWLLNHEQKCKQQSLFENQY